MKEITIYECEDGSRFDDKWKAERYDEILEKTKKIMAPIGDAVTEMYSAKQRNKAAVERAVLEFMHLCAWCIPDWKETFEEVENIDDAHCSIIGRVLSDYRNEWKCLAKAFFRFSCISDVSYIEYEQPYWTSHEDEYQQELLNHNKQNN